MPKTMTVRLSDEQAAELEAVARVDGQPVSETVREAIAARIAERRADKEFQERLKAHMETFRSAFERLAQ